jgi:hypothetical protein
MRRKTEEVDKNGDPQPSTCNLGLFGLSYPEFEAHPRFGQIEVLDNVRWLSLTFPSAEKRMAFQKSLDMACALRDHHRLGFEENATAARVRAFKPNRAMSGNSSSPRMHRPSEAGSTFSHNSSVMTSSSTMSDNPKHS